MRLSFRELHLQAKVKLGGSDLLMAGTFIGWDGKNWVRADGDKVEARMVTVEPGYPGERVNSARGAVCATEDPSIIPGLELVLGRQKVGFVADGEMIVFDISPLPAEVVNDGDTTGTPPESGKPVVAEPEAPRTVRNRNRRHYDNSGVGGTGAIRNGDDPV